MGNPHVIALIEDWLVSYLAERLGIESQAIDIRQPFAHYGLASIEGISLVTALEERLQRPLSPTLAWEYPSIEALANHLADDLSIKESDLMADSEPKLSNEPIAIIGMGCRFPGAKNLDEFWQLLCSGSDAVTTVPADRWNVDEFYDPTVSAPAKMVSRWGGFLEGLDQFDAPFFRISPREAAQLDPRQRILLEAAWEAIEDAGIPIEQLAGSKTGVFTATLSSNYASLLFDSYLNVVDAYSGTGNGNSVTANRLSYIFGLHGPSMALDTACSGSLVAIHLACQSLRTGESTMAIAGGVNVILKPDDSVFFSKTGALSPDGRCKVFDSRANGIVRSEGAGLVVLKPLSKAMADGDRVYAVIRGSAVNQDGSSNGILAPNGQAQEAMLRDAYQRAGIAPAQVQYIEAHGTGTSLGDPIEVKALGNVLGVNRPDDRRCALGSVKTNIGHTEAAAGIAGVIKASLSIKHRMIPGNLHFEQPNPLIPFDKLPFFVQQGLGPWPSQDEPLIAGVSGFGFAGTNAHVVLAEAPQAEYIPNPAAPSEQPILLPLSARSPEALRTLAQRFDELLAQRGDQLPLYDLSYSASVRRSHLDQRLAIVARSTNEAREQIAAYLAGEPRQGLAHGNKRLDQQLKLAFVFSGQGSHWINMGRELLQTEQVFRATLEHCDQLLRQYVPWSLIEEIARPEAESRLNDTDIAQPAIFATQVGLAALWRSWGITPSVIVGQSLGEVAAAHVAGALSLDQAVQVIYHRSRLMKRVAGQGKTAVVGLPLEQAKLVLTGFEDLIAVAGSNSQNTSVLSGDPQSLERILKSLERQGVFCRMLKGVDIAFHSPQMDPLKDELIESLAHIQPQPEAMPIFSTVKGALVPGTTFDAAYWGDNLREPFLFSTAIRELINQGYSTFLEVSPHPVLSSSILEDVSLMGKQAQVISSLRRAEDERWNMLDSLARLYALGQTVDWRKLYLRPGIHVDLPHYPWQRERYWFDQLADGVEPFGFRPYSGKSGGETAKKGGAHPLLGEHNALAHPVGQHVWDIDLNAATPFYLKDHKVQGAVVLPGSAYVEMALSAASKALGPGSYALDEVVFKNALVLPASGARRVELIVTPIAPAMLEFSIHSRSSAAATEWTLHAAGKISVLAEPPAPPALISIPAAQTRCVEEVTASAHYDAMLERGLYYGPAFQSVTQVWRRDGEALGQLSLPQVLHDEAGRYQIHPALLDACFQVVALAGQQTGPEGGPPEMRLPVGVANVTIYRQPGTKVWCHVQIPNDTDYAADVVSADLYIRDEQGETIASIGGLSLQRIEGTAQQANQNINDWFYELFWKPVQSGAAAGEALPAFLPSVFELAETAQLINPLLADLHQLEVYERSPQEFDHLATLYIARMFGELGWNPAVGERFTSAELADRLNITAKQRSLFERMLHILREDGLLEQTADGWTVLRAPQSGDALSLWERQIQLYPQSEPLLILLKRCGENLAAAMRDEQDPLQLLFGGDPTTIERFYTQIPYAKVYNSLVVEAVKHALLQLPADRPLRILEIGAGTGTTTSYVLPVLPAGQTEYTFTDLSMLFMAKAEQKFSAYPFMKYRTLDIERDPVEQGYQPESFDLIFATNVLHATADIHQTLTHTRRLLADGGKLIMLESPGPVRWLDVTFGLTDGWWRFTDHALRPTYALLSADQWIACLRETGFAEAVQLTDGRPGSPQYIILAEATAAAPQPVVEAAPAEVGSWLILMDDSGVGAGIAARLEARGQQCILVSPAETYSGADKHRFAVSPTSKADFAQMLKIIRDEHPPLKGIIHLWSMLTPVPEQTSFADLRTGVDLACSSVISLVQGMMEAELRQSPRIWCVTEGAQAVAGEVTPLAFNQASLWGIGRVLPIEHPELKPVLIDLDPGGGERNIAQLFNEIWKPGSETQIGFRHGQAYGLRVVQAAGYGQSSLPTRFRPDASYLITGGLSGIGLETARWMIEHGARRLIVLSRSQLPARSLWTQLGDSHPQAERVQAVRDLEALGASVHVAAVDVGDEIQLSTFLSTYQQEGWPAIRGVIHSAGLIKDQLMMRMDQATFDAAIQPKIFGAWLLHSLLKDEPLDFFVLFSTGSSLMGMIGQSNYASGNAFMDSLAYYRRAKGLPGVSINWGLWVDVGIVARSNNLQDVLTQGGLIGIKPEQGMKILGQIIQHNPIQIAPMPTDWATWRQVNSVSELVPLYELLPTGAPDGASNAPSAGPAEHSFLKELITLDAVEREAALGQYVQELTAGVLRINKSRLDIHQPLNMLGLDSIMAVELKNRIEASVGVTVSIVELLQGMTLEQLAGKLIGELKFDDDLGDLLDELEQLSLDDVQSMLNSGISADGRE